MGPPHSSRHCGTATSMALVLPHVSVLLPARNAAATLPACLRSLERQTCRGWECVIVDDGSTDGTRAIGEDWSRRDPRFRVMMRRVTAARAVDYVCAA